MNAKQKEIKQNFDRTDIKMFVKFCKETMVPDDEISVMFANLKISAKCWQINVGTDSYTKIEIRRQGETLSMAYDHQNNNWLPQVYGGN